MLKGIGNYNYSLPFDIRISEYFQNLLNSRGSIHWRTPERPHNTFKQNHLYPKQIYWAVDPPCLLNSFVKYILLKSFISFIYFVRVYSYILLPLSQFCDTSWLDTKFKEKRRYWNLCSKINLRYLCGHKSFH